MITFITYLFVLLPAVSYNNDAEVVIVDFVEGLIKMNEPDTNRSGDFASSVGQQNAKQHSWRYTVFIVDLIGSGIPEGATIDTASLIVETSIPVENTDGYLPLNYEYYIRRIDTTNIQWVTEENFFTANEYDSTYGLSWGHEGDIDTALTMDDQMGPFILPPDGYTGTIAWTGGSGVGSGTLSFLCQDALDNRNGWLGLCVLCPNSEDDLSPDNKYRVNWYSNENVSLQPILHVKYVRTTSNRPEHRPELRYED